jgi:hypothetical protein
MNLSDFAVELALELYGAPTDLVQRELANASVEFYRTTGAWQIEQGPQIIDSTTTEFELDLPANTSLNVLMAARIGNRPLGNATRGQRYSSALSGNIPSVYYINSGGRVSVAPQPVAPFSDFISFLFCVTPKRTITAIPDELLDDHYDAIASGAKARLMMLPGQLWTNATLAVDYRKQFAAKMGDARLDWERDSVAFRARIRTPGFGRLSWAPLGDFPNTSAIGFNQFLVAPDTGLVDGNGNLLVFA